MRLSGWITLVVALTGVWGLAIWSYWKVLTAPPDDVVVKPPDSLGG